MHAGDIVLFIPRKKLPIPRGEVHMWTLGRLLTHTGPLIHLVDTCGQLHIVYPRFVKELTLHEQ